MSGPPAAGLRQRDLMVGPLVAALTLVTALLATGAAGVPLQDPGHVTTFRLAVTAGLVAILVGLDVVIGASRRSGGRIPTRAAMRRARRERWTPARAWAVGIALVSFYVTYMAYRNLKAVVPLLRPGDLFDRQLASVDRTLFAGHDPAALLHSLLGTGLAAHALSAMYMLFFVFIPVSLALALVFARQPRAGLFYTTALSLNWVLGAASYFLMPSIGPFHADPTTFANLPTTPVGDLQVLLLHQRAGYLHHPAASGAFQSIGAFASLHVSVYFTAAMAAHLLRLHPVVKTALWFLAALTVSSTIYFGWHYVLDDLGGVTIAVVALGAARVLIGSHLDTGRRPRRIRTPTPEPA